VVLQHLTERHGGGSAMLPIVFPIAMGVPCYVYITDFIIENSLIQVIFWYRAASGPRSSGTMTGPRGARCTGAGEGPPVCTRRFQETRPGVELRGQSLGERRGGAPKGERVPLDARPCPKRIWVATSDAWRGLTGQLRLFGAPPPLIFLEAKASWLWSAKLGRRCVARMRALAPSAPAIAGGGWRAPQKRKEFTCPNATIPAG
jgi:hypothetical protein